VLEATVHSQALYPSKDFSSFTKSRSDALVWGTDSISDLIRQFDQFVLSSSGVNTTLFNFLVTEATDSSLSASKNYFAVVADWGGVAVLTRNPLLTGDDLFGGTVKQIRTLLQLDLEPSVINSQRLCSTYFSRVGLLINYLTSIIVAGMTTLFWSLSQMRR